MSCVPCAGSCAHFWMIVYWVPFTLFTAQVNRAHIARLQRSFFFLRLIEVNMLLSYPTSREALIYRTRFSELEPRDDL